MLELLKSAIKLPSHLVYISSLPTQRLKKVSVLQVICYLALLAVIALAYVIQLKAATLTAAPIASLSTTVAAYILSGVIRCYAPARLALASLSIRQGRVVLQARFNIKIVQAYRGCNLNATPIIIRGFNLSITPIIIRGVNLSIALIIVNVEGKAVLYLETIVSIILDKFQLLLYKFLLEYSLVCVVDLPLI